MAIRLKARAGESVEQLMRRFKKLCEKEGLTKEVKRREYYEKPSERKQRALRKAVKRQQQILEESGLGPSAANSRKPKPKVKPRGRMMRGGGGGRGPSKT